MGKDMGGIDFAAYRRKIEANSTLIRTVIRGLQKNGYKKTPQENSYGVWDRKKALILSYQRLFFRRYLILNLTPRSLPPKKLYYRLIQCFLIRKQGKHLFFFWSRVRESNPPPRLGKHNGRFYHWLTKAGKVLYLQRFFGFSRFACFEIFGGFLSVFQTDSVTIT